MSLWMMPAESSCRFARLAGCLDVPSPGPLLGPTGRRPVRPRPSHRHQLAAGGRRHRRVPPGLRPALDGRPRTAWMAAVAPMRAVLPRLGAGQSRRPFAPDDTPTKRYGPCVEGAGVHHNPTPGPAGQTFVYGHVWVTLAWVARTPAVGEHRPAAAGAACTSGKRTCRGCRRSTAGRSAPSWRWRRNCCVGWRRGWAAGACACGWSSTGAYAPPRGAAGGPAGRSRWSAGLRKDAALCDLPGPRPAGRRGRPAIYGEQRIDLAKRAGQRRGWRTEAFDLYGRNGGRDVTRRSWRRGGRPAASSAWRRCGGARRGRRSSAPTRRRPRRTCRRRWRIGRPSSRRSTTSRRCGARAGSSCANVYANVGGVPSQPVAAHAGRVMGVGAPGGAADRPPGVAVGRPGPPAVSCGQAAGRAAGIPAPGISRRWRRRGPSGKYRRLARRLLQMVH